MTQKKEKMNRKERDRYLLLVPEGGIQQFLHLDLLLDGSVTVPPHSFRVPRLLMRFSDGA